MSNDSYNAVVGVFIWCFLACLVVFKFLFWVLKVAGCFCIGFYKGFKKSAIK
jgi:hypothetical protein